MSLDRERQNGRHHGDLKLVGWKLDQQRTIGAAIGSLVSFLAVVLLCWAVSFWPAVWLSPKSGAFWMTIALAACAIPGFVNVWLAGLGKIRNPLVGMWIQMGLRVAVVMATVFVVRGVWPEVGIREFYGWLIGFYLCTMGLEVWMFGKSIVPAKSVQDRDRQSN